MECEVILSHQFSRPCITLCLLTILLKLLQSIDIKDPATSVPTTTLILGTVKYIHIRKDMLNEKGTAVDFKKLKPIARLGGVLYGRVTEEYNIERLSWREHGDGIKEFLAGVKP